uniref:Uncharacterized protein n=1 Tax=Nothobranchius furzeri TaxID=105023 RepID=A0A8C6KR53_NOTFU
MQAAQPQYDFFSEDNNVKWKGLLVPSLEKVHNTDPQHTHNTDPQHTHNMDPQ